MQYYSSTAIEATFIKIMCKNCNTTTTVATLLRYCANTAVPPQ